MAAATHVTSAVDPVAATAPALVPASEGTNEAAAGDDVEPALAAESEAAAFVRRKCVAHPSLHALCVRHRIRSVRDLALISRHQFVDTLQLPNGVLRCTLSPVRDLYEKFADRAFPPALWPAVAEVLSLLLTAEQPTLQQVLRSASLLPERAATRQSGATARALKALQQFLTLQQSSAPMRVYHKSFADCLVLSSARKYHISDQSRHDTYAARAAAAVVSAALRPDDPDAALQSLRAVTRNPQLQWAWRHSDDLNPDAVMASALPTVAHVLHCAERSGVEVSLWRNVFGCVTPLHMSIAEKLPPVSDDARWYALSVEVHTRLRAAASADGFLAAEFGRAVAARQPERVRCVLRHLTPHARTVVCGRLKSAADFDFLEKHKLLRFDPKYVQSVAAVEYALSRCATPFSARAWFSALTDAGCTEALCSLMPAKHEQSVFASLGDAAPALEWLRMQVAYVQAVFAGLPNPHRRDGPAVAAAFNDVPRTLQQLDQTLERLKKLEFTSRSHTPAPAGRSSASAFHPRR